ncbi:luciferin 4-monooxygenase-like [Pectinophora gossypiella]|uniref:luciferin 4-monooxygenase-like n=1 Tax=Pectinophora gossypiella TaxID=13191 RepID=UPI00214E875B|nr:luciferin 4-monooxygenase-like [Pectinophora gossypiella]
MPENIEQRVNKLRIKAAQRYNIAPERCHVGHLALEGMLERPSAICQIDGATNAQETNISVATRSMRLASAMKNAGFKPGDPIIISGPNHLDLAIPYYACHFMGYSMCSIDPSAEISDLKSLYGNIQPKIVFCQKENLEKNKEALEANRLDNVEIVAFDDMENFIQKHRGTEVNFKPSSDFDQSKTAAWYILTSGSTGLPKVAIITFDTLLNGVIEWWLPTRQDVIHMNMLMTSTQWLSSLIYFISSSIKPFVRLQSSQPVSPPLLVHMINTYKPTSTAWTPYLLARFVQAPAKVVDLSCFKHILVGGAPSEKHIIEEFKKLCDAELHLCYGMTELLVGCFDYNEKTTPFGSSGKPFSKYRYRLVDDEGQEVTEPHKNGELWVKGDAFFKGYLNNEKETKEMLTDDGWLKTGDIFYRDENDNYFFVERKRLLIRYLTTWVSPVQLEQIIRQHPSVSEVCVVGLSNPQTMEYPVAAILKKNGNVVEPQEIFDLVKKEMPEAKHLHGGLFFVEGFPMTPSGKVHRSKVAEMARQSERVFSLN